MASCLVSLCATTALAANKTWNGGTSTDFWLGGNWAGGNAPVSDLTTDVGVFAGTVTANQPSLTASGSITGLSFTTSSGGWTLGSNSSANILSLGVSGISSTNTSGTNTISANIALGATQTWQAGTGGTLRITGGVYSGSVGSPSASAFTIGAGSNNGTVVFDPAAGNTIAIYSNATNQAFAITKATLFGSAANSTSGTNVISHSTSGITVGSGAALTVNSGVWVTNDLGRNTGNALAGDVKLNAGTLTAGGGRFMLTFNNSASGTSAGQWNVDGGTLKITGSSNNVNGSSFQLGASITGTPSTTANFNLRSGLVDVAKGVGTQNNIGSIASTTPPTVLMNQSGGVAQFGVTAGSDPFTGATNGNSLNNLYIGAVGGSGTGVKAAYTLSGGRLLVAGGLQGNGPAAGSNGVSNFNFMGGTLTAGTVVATNLGSSATATSSTNQVASSDSIGTLVNYGGVLAPGGDALTITNDQYGNSSIATSAVAGKTTITGNYVVSSTNAALAVNLAGTTASTTFQEAVNSTRFSNVAISGGGTNTLGGNLLVSLIPGSGGTTFAPTNANTFKIVTFTGAGATNSGTFAGANVSGTNVIATDGLTAFAITYDYTAATGGVTLGGATANQWNASASGANWNTAGNWTAMAPNTSAFIARFADGASVPTGANAVDLANTLTIQGIQLSSTSRQYTISSSNGSGLTLDASPRNTTNLMTNATTAATAQIADSSAGAGNHTIAVPLTLASDLAVSVSNAASTVTISGNVSGAGRALAKSGSGTLVLSGSNSYTGSTTVTGGTLSVTSPNALPGWNASGKVTVGTGAGLTITSAFSAGDLTTLLTNVTFSGSNRLGIDTTSGNLSYSTAITDKGTGGFGLIKLGSGTLTLSGSNSYTGGTVIGTTSSATSAIVVQGNQSAATGGWTIGAANAGRNTVTFDAGSAVAVATGREIQVGSKSSLGSTATSQTLTVSGTVTNNGSFYAGRGGQVTLQSGAVWTQSGSATLEAIGGAAVSLNVNTGASYAYTGTTTFLVIGAAASNGVATVAIAGGTFSTARGFEQTSNLTNTGYGRVSLSSGGVLRLIDTIPVLSSGSTHPVRFELGSGGGTINTNGFDAGLAAAISGSGGLTKAGAGTLTLSGSNSYSGITQIAAGTLQLGASTALSASSAVTVAGGVLDLSSYAATAGGFTITSGSLAGAGTLTAPSYGLGGGTVTGNLGSGTVTVTAHSALNGTSAATALNLNSGTLTLGGGGGRFTQSGIAVTGSAGAGLVLGGNESFGSLTGAANVALGSSTLSVGSAGTSGTFAGVLSGVGGGLTKTGAGKLTFTAAQLYTGNTLVSGGTLALSGAGSLAQSAYIKAGLAANDGGVLDVTALGSGLQVANGQKLGGYGTVLGDVTIAGGAIVAPGGSIGSLTNLGTETWGPGGHYLFEITNANGAAPGTSWDLLTVSALTITATASPFVIDLQTLTNATDQAAGLMDGGNWNQNSDYRWQFLVATNTTFSAANFNSGWFSVVATNFLNSQNGGFSVAYGGSGPGGLGGDTQSNALYIVYAAVPEPGSLALAGIGLAGAAWAAARRRRRAE